MPPAASTPAPTPALARKPSLGALFEHYGVELDIQAEQPAAVIEGEYCPSCDWVVRADERSCRMCARELDGPQLDASS